MIIIYSTINYFILTTNGTETHDDANKVINETRSFLNCFIWLLVDLNIKRLNNP